jgi:glycosyltransferase involved in cell wall biosynthesis
VKILQCHNFYQQPGGEDQVFHDEAHLLRSYGHEVIQFTRHNDVLRDMPAWQAAVRTVWNRETVRELRSTIRKERPAIVHFTNTFPLISPAAYYAARKEGVKVVQSLHNYRLLCPNAQFLRDGRVCESCLLKTVPWPAVRYSCYRNDRRSTAVVAGMLTIHRAMGTWKRAVDLYLALTEFGRRKFIEGGLPAEKIAVKPNFIRVDPGAGDGLGKYAVFVGRLSTEKGIDTLLNAWSHLQGDLKLSIVGDGPLAGRVRDAAAQDPRIQWLGFQPPDRVLEIIGSARFLVLPSLWYEGLPKIIVEAFSKGTPVVASNLGAMTELIDPGRTGLLFTPGDPASLIESVAKLSNDGDVLARMRVAVRHEFEQKFTPEANYQILMAAYARVLGAAFPNATAISQDAAFSGMPAGETLSNGLLAASR